MILIIISFLIITSYVGVMINRQGIPYSISDTYYSLKHKLWFGFTMIFTAGLLMPSILNRTPETYQFTAFLMCAGLFFVGLAPNFRKGMDRPIHIGATTVAAICSQVWVVLSQPFVLIIWLAWIAYIIVRIRQVWNGVLWTSFVICKPLFWAEVIAFFTIYLSLFI